jgi:hypothetical protein
MPVSTPSPLLTPHEHADLLPQARVNDAEVDALIAAMRRLGSRQIARAEAGTGSTNWRDWHPLTLRLMLRFARVLDLWSDPRVALLNDKVAFVGFMRELGYFAPDTLHVPAEPFDPEAMKPRLHELGNGAWLLKPKDGSKGKGLLRTTRIEEVLEHLVYTAQDYLVQPCLPILRDFRYMVYTDTEGRQWRSVYDKRCPSFVSDGRPLYQQVMDRKAELGQRGLASLRDRYRHRSFEPIPAGEKLFVALSGNMAQGAEYIGLTPTETANLDRFMSGVRAEMAAKCGRDFSFFCVDLGAMEMDLLSRPYDQDTLRRRLVFFEYQFFANVVIDNGDMDPQEFYHRMKAMYVRDALARTADMPGPAP